MKPSKHDFALGLTTIGVIALFVGTVVFLYPALQPAGREVKIYFRQEDGLAPLRPGSQVLLSDSLDVGRVLNVWVQEVEDSKAPGAQPHAVFVVLVSIQKGVPLYGNCQITTNQPAIGGAGYVSILNIGTPNVPLVEPVRGLPPESLAATIGAMSRRLLSPGGLIDELNRAVDPDVENSMMHKVLVSLDDVNAITRELREQMNPREEQALLHKIQRVLDDLNATTASLRAEMTPGNDAALLAKLHQALAHLDAGLMDASAMLQESRPLVHDTLASVAHAAKSVDQDMVAALRKELDPANPDAILGKLHMAMNRVDASLRDLLTATGEAQRAVVLGRPAIEKTLANFVAMSEQLRLASQEVLLNPSKLIWGPSRERQDKLVIFEAASNFASAASQLDNAVTRLQAVLRTLPPEGAVTGVERQEIQAIQEAVKASFERFGRAEEVLWNQLK